MMMDLTKKKKVTKALSMLCLIGVLIPIGISAYTNISSATHQYEKSHPSQVEKEAKTYSSPYEGWIPGKLFINDSYVGNSKPFKVNDDTFVLDDQSLPILEKKFETTLDNGSKVYLIKVKKAEKEKTYPLILLDEHTAILQLANEKGKRVGMSYTR